MWVGWPLERILLIFAGIAFLLIFFQVYMFHSRQNFRHWAMWIPVIATPVFTVALIALAFFHADWLQLVVMVLMLAGVVAGIYGAYLHTVGVGQRVGGYSQTQNFLVGPPVILPLLITAISALGLLALFWGW